AGRWTLAGTLDVIAPHVPPGLVPADAWVGVRRVAERLPAALTCWAYLESRLGRDDAPVDLIVGVEEGAGRDLLRGANPVLRLADGLAAHHERRRVAALCRAWA